MQQPRWGEPVLQQYCDTFSGNATKIVNTFAAPQKSLNPQDSPIQHGESPEVARIVSRGSQETLNDPQSMSDTVLQIVQGKKARVLLAGDAGTGKTVLAKQVFDKAHLPLKLWVNHPNIYQDYHGFGVAVKLFQSEASEACKERNVLNEVNQYLQKYAHAALVVLDGVTSTRDIPHVFHNEARLLVTSRCRLDLGFLKRIEIPVMTLAEAKELVLQIASEIKEDDPQLDELIKELHYLPLALTQAANCINRPGWSLQKYLKAYQADPSKLLASDYNLSTAVAFLYPEQNGENREKTVLKVKTVMNTWQLSLNEVTQQNAKTQAVLDICAFLEGTAIPMQALQDYLITTGVVVATEFDDVMDALYDHSLLQRNKHQECTIHCLLQQVLRINLRQTRESQFIDIPQSLLGFLFARYQKNIEVSHTENLTIHCLQIIHHLMSTSILQDQPDSHAIISMARDNWFLLCLVDLKGFAQYSECISLFRDIAILFYQNAQDPKAEFLSAALKLQEDYYQITDHHTMAKTLYYLADAQIRHDNFSSGLCCLQRMFNIFQKHSMQHHYQVNAVLQSLQALQESHSAFQSSSECKEELKELTQKIKAWAQNLPVHIPTTVAQNDSSRSFAKSSIPSHNVLDNQQENLMKYVTPPREYLLMSIAAYSDLDEANKKSLPSAHHELTTDSGWKLHTGKIIAGDSGYRGAIYVHEDRKEVCIAHRGSQNFGSFKADFQIVVQGNKDKLHSIAAIGNTLPYAKEFLDKGYQLSTTGHSLGGFLALLLSYMVAREGMVPDYYYPEIICRSFDAPGCYDFLNELQPSDSLHQVQLEQLNAINFVAKPDIVNTINKQFATIVNLDNENGKVWGDLLSLGTVHAKDRLLTLFDKSSGYPQAEHCLVMGQWPTSSQQTVEKVLGALSGKPDKIIELFGGAAISGVTSVASATTDGICTLLSGLKSLFLSSPAVSPTLEEQAVKVLLTQLPDTLQGYVSLPDSPFYEVLPLRHFRKPIREFLEALNFCKEMSVMGAFFIAHPSFTQEDRSALACITLDDKNRVVYRPISVGQPNNVFELLERLETLYVTAPDNMDFKRFAKLWYDQIAQQALQLEKIPQMIQEEMQKLVSATTPRADNGLPWIEFECITAADNGRVALVRIQTVEDKSANRAAFLQLAQGKRLENNVAIGGVRASGNAIVVVTEVLVDGKLIKVADAQQILRDFQPVQQTAFAVQVPEGNGASSADAAPVPGSAAHVLLPNLTQPGGSTKKFEPPAFH